jgi:hypothetical protein
VQAIPRHSTASPSGPSDCSACMLLDDWCCWPRRFSFTHHISLQYMLEKQRVELFRIIADCSEFSVHTINLSRLYIEAKDR